MPTFVHQHSGLEKNMLRVQLIQDGCHVLIFYGPSNETCSSVLGGLQSLQQMTTDACNNTVKGNKAYTNVFIACGVTALLT